MIIKFFYFDLSQIGPEKGALHLAVAGIVNAIWDLWARIEGKVNYST